MFHVEQIRNIDWFLILDFSHPGRKVVPRGTNTIELVTRLVLKTQ